MNGCLSKLGQLGRDNAGNTLAIAAASLIPLIALIGGGVDVSRAYMAKTQLQSACDAGVLAGRKAMSKSGTYGTSEKAKASSMFNFNFNSKSLDVKNVSYVTDDNDDGQVLGTATATLPTLIMKIFDRDNVQLSVDCMAELQIGNADIMFVLDTTGSMLCTPEDTKASCTQLSNTNTTTRIYGLREAVKDFHKTINQSVTDNRTRIRYGFVPYSSTVNIGDLVTAGSVPTSYLVDSMPIQGRFAEYSSTNPIYVANSPSSPVNTTETYSSNITQANCQTATNNYGNNKYPTSTNTNPVSGGGPAPAATTVTTYSFQSWTKVSGSGTSALGTCKRNKSVVTTTYATWYQFTRWIYGPRNINTASIKTRAPTNYAYAVTTSTTVGATSRSKTAGTFDMVTLAQRAAAGDVTGVSYTSGASPTSPTTGGNNSWYGTGTWSGCIEERKTTQPTASYDYDPVPTDSHDLNFDRVPTSSDDNTRWRPLVPNLYYMKAAKSGETSYYLKQSDNTWRTNAALTSSAVTLPVPYVDANNWTNSTSPMLYCPSPMMLLRNVELTDGANDVPSWLTTYVNNLTAIGGTYHDIGMIWGGRLTSPTGLFKSNVNLDADKINVSKHVIFMTDGQMAPNSDVYSAYGVEEYDHRIAPSGSESQLTARHNARFSAMCEAIKAQGTTIWVVSFASTMTTELQNCATGGRAYYSSNTTALKNTFKYIAAQVADLRLGA